MAKNAAIFFIFKGNLLQAVRRGSQYLKALKK
jgi:hypothetical protein